MSEQLPYSDSNTKKIEFNDYGTVREADFTAQKQNLVFQFDGKVVTIPNSMFPINNPLSPRLTEVLQLASDGHCYKEIAGLTGLRTQTIKDDMSEVYKRLGARDKTTAVLKGFKMGIIHLNGEQ